ncbi:MULTISPECIES: histidinol-phosphate transaminase [unclassified Enterococcus]|uniref:histidinol-phosphate transaminase n=1 Tax=unclassified Enterococcus TaxID=2608891 RepID=UPI001558227F|nr:MULTISPECIES: histidinol-phosphate transaminase [unclassified Enterococcus]MBS7577238.1 histidinol-phosphate transaminase [Enterococcus sp. MMGLQ5-2]MBS7584669.1 histidinol-phosphate transaminase [Enterococcus sp. MMGLQ5-1]NPD12524.1 histidinol-phosphate transaminase [Enterococcus sp. MMGLQ5-1]NPD37072.1 histidinol-phosphate transaminase [Enterococcus sp. MMGLQ5-2]
MRGLRKIEPYIPGDQPKFSKMIKINTNENAYPPSPKVSSALANFDTNQLRLYSSLDNHHLTSALSKRLNINADWITTANGSDDVLALAFQSFFNSSDPIIFPDLTYGFYSVWCELFGIPYQEVLLDENFDFDFNKIPDKIGGIVLANPNAPTGRYKALEQIEKILKKYHDIVVIVDEAYIEFGGESVLALLKKYENLYITRTFSKDAALAGLRVGYGIGNPNLTGVIQAVKNSYNPYAVDSISETLAVAATEDYQYYQEINGEIAKTRDWFIAELDKIGFNTVPSLTNFVLTTHPQQSAAVIFNALKKNQVFVRFFPTKERINNYLRISIGTKNEMITVIDLLKNVLAENDGGSK